MSNPLVHAERSAKKWGGQPEDYLELHRWFDATKGHLADNRHRVVLHNAFGILLCEQVFGAAITNSAGRRVFVRDIGVQHVTEDLGYVPSLAECLGELPLRPWMAGVPHGRRRRSEAAQEPEVEHCPECEGDDAFTSGLPGVLACVEHGRIKGIVERCDACGRYPSDAAARRALEQHLSRLSEEEQPDGGPV